MTVCGPHNLMQLQGGVNDPTRAGKAGEGGARRAVGGGSIMTDRAMATRRRDARGHWRVGRRAVPLALAVLLLGSAAAAQEVRVVYDQKGQVVATIDVDGSAAVLTWDPNGNLL